MSIIEADFRLKRNDFLLDINCKIDAPITGVFGPSGAGKTSLLHALAGLAYPTDGSILINGKEVFNAYDCVDLPPEKRNIGYVFQEGRLFPHMNVGQNLKYGLKQKFDFKKFSEITDLLKITDLLGKKISQISGGQAQRVAIGRALLSSPEILVLDEPFSSLDKYLRHHIISLLKPLVNKFEIPLLVVSHDLTDLLMLTDQLLIVNDGECKGIGSYYDLITKSVGLKELSQSGLINSIQLKLEYVDGEKGMMILSDQKNQVYAESWMNGQSFLEENELTVFLRPEDVTLALHRIEDISIQNQIEGRIEKLVTTKNKVLCIIDHGFKLIAEVTLATKEKMKLKEGQNIWSLFKAAAVKMNAPGISNSVEL